MTVTNVILVLITLMLMLQSCGQKERRNEVPDDEVVVSVGDSTLLLGSVVQQIPVGMSAEDSTALFRTIVETWLRRQVLISTAERNIGDMSQIDKMVEDYRADLILSRYLSMMDEKRTTGRDSKAVTRYYAEHKDSMILDEPLVKGLFLKVTDDDPRLEDLRVWMHTATGEAVDNLERYGLSRATQYEYFKDKWHPWHEVTELIPYRFYDADAFLESTRDFETTYGGSVYMIHISEYIPSGELMPEDYARGVIAQMLRQTDVSARRQKLIREIYSREIEEGRLRGGLYDPATGNMHSPASERKQLQTNIEK